MYTHVNRSVVNALAAIALLGSAAAFAAGAPHIPDPYGVAASGEFHQNKMPSRIDYINVCTREANYKHLSGGARDSFLKSCERNG
jgi:hypothetical protein